MSEQDQSVAVSEPADAAPIASAGMLEVMLRVAAQRPRDEQFALESALNELRTVPQLAEKAYYSIPYEDKDIGRKVPVEGLTIGSAMALVRRWGNMVTGGRIVSEDETGFDVEGLCYDLESNTLNGRPIRVSKFYKPKGQQNSVRPLAADKKIQAVQSGISKAIRNAVLKTLPEWMQKAYFNEAKHLVLNPPKMKGGTSAPTKSIQERILDARAIFKKTWAVTDEEMKNYLDGLSLETENEVLIHLQGLFNGIKEGNSNVNEVFGRKSTESAPSMPQEKVGA